jgi:hypothetical protein
MPAEIYVGPDYQTITAAIPIGILKPEHRKRTIVPRRPSPTQAVSSARQRSRKADHAQSTAPSCGSGHSAVSLRQTATEPNVPRYN